MRLMPASFDGHSVSDETYSSYFTVNDYVKLREAYNIALPASEQGTRDYVAAVENVPTGLATPSYIGGFFNGDPNNPISSQYLGFDPLEVDSEIDQSSGLDALMGKFNPQATADALSKHDQWPQSAKDSYATEDYRNLVIYSWGDGTQEDMTARFAPPDLDYLGRARPLAVSNQDVFYSYSTAGVKAMIDASTSQTASLAGLPAYASVANGLSELGAYSAFISPYFFYNTSNTQETSQAPLLEKYVAAGVGVGKDDAGVYMALVLVHDSATAASANAGILQTRINSVSWSSQYSTGAWKQFVSDAQIHTEGNVLLAKLYGPNPKFWLNAVNGYLPLLLHK